MVSLPVIILGIVVGGVALGFVSFAVGRGVLRWRAKRKLKKRMPEARFFLKNLNKNFPIKTSTQEQLIQREQEMIDSGFSYEELNLAQSLVPSDEETIVEWFQEAMEIHGQSIFEAEQTLLSNGWSPKLINQAKKRLFKTNKLKGVQNGRKTRQVPSFQRDAGATTRTNGDGDGEVEHKRILPVSTSHAVERDKSKSQWSWRSFKQDG